MKSGKLQNIVKLKVVVLYSRKCAVCLCYSVASKCAYYVAKTRNSSSYW